MKATEREKAIQLRLEEEWSYGAIARELKVAKSTLSTWLKDLPLSEERMLELRRSGWQKGELKRERFRETMRTKRLLRESEIYEEQLKQFSNLEEQAIFRARQRFCRCRASVERSHATREAAILRA